MDNRMRQSLDNYIMGTHLTREDMVPHKCIICGEARLIRMLYDMGGWFYIDDDDAFCHNTEMEIIES